MVGGASGDAPQRLVLLQTAAADLSCTQPSSAAECSNPWATLGHNAKPAAILHSIDSSTRVQLTTGHNVAP